MFVDGVPDNEGRYFRAESASLKCLRSGTYEFDAMMFGPRVGPELGSDLPDADDARTSDLIIRVISTVLTDEDSSEVVGVNALDECSGVNLKTEVERDTVTSRQEHGE